MKALRGYSKSFLDAWRMLAYSRAGVVADSSAVNASTATQTLIWEMRMGISLSSAANSIIVDSKSEPSIAFRVTEGNVHDD